MHPFNLKTLLALFVFALLSAGFAQHNPDHDVYINIDAPVVGDVAKELELDETGDDLYDTQEGVHKTGKDLTGKEVKRYYINICLSGECVPVDPMRVSN